MSRLKARKQGFYIRLVYALLEGDEKTVTKAKVLAELRAIKIACLFLQKIKYLLMNSFPLTLVSA